MPRIWIVLTLFCFALISCTTGGASRPDAPAPAPSGSAAPAAGVSGGLYSAANKLADAILNWSRENPASRQRTFFLTDRDAVTEAGTELADLVMEELEGLLAEGGLTVLRKDGMVYGSAGRNLKTVKCSEVRQLLQAAYYIEISVRSRGREIALRAEVQETEGQRVAFARRVNFIPNPEDRAALERKAKTAGEPGTLYNPFPTLEKAAMMMVGRLKCVLGEVMVTKSVLVVGRIAETSEMAVRIFSQALSETGLDYVPPEEFMPAKMSIESRFSDPRYEDRHRARYGRANIVLWLDVKQKTDTLQYAAIQTETLLPLSIRRPGDTYNAAQTLKAGRGIPHAGTHGYVRGAEPEPLRITDLQILAPENNDPYTLDDHIVNGKETLSLAYALSVTANQDCKILLVNVDSHGYGYRLFPTPCETGQHFSHDLKASEPARYPDERSPWHYLGLDDNTGNEDIYAVAYRDEAVQQRIWEAVANEICGGSANPEGIRGTTVELPGSTGKLTSHQKKKKVVKFEKLLKELKTSFSGRMACDNRTFYHSSK